ARLVIAVDSTQVSRADSALQKFGNTTSVVERQTDTLSSTVSRLAGPLAALTAGVSIKGLIDISDNYGQMADRIKMATTSTQEYVMVQDRLLQSANKTYRPLVEAQELYIRTADAIRSLGYETSDALDITDSFSYLLVTNAASADRASSAINAYSKAIQTGKVDSESWQSILAAMPSVVETLADELGRSSNEIRELGITGKLALADLNEGLRRSVEETKAAADGMGVTLNDAIIRATNNWSTYLGESERVTSASRLMSGTLDTVSENLDTVASVASGVAVAAMARYSVALTQSTYASVSSAVSTARQASEELSLAQQQVASTATTLAKLRANYELTGVTTGLTAATIAHEQAEKRLAVAQTASVGLGRTALGLAGGWAGLAVTAGAVALSFVDWGDNAEEAARQSIALREETNLLTRAVQELDAAQAKQVLQRMADPYQAAKDEARNYAAQVEYLNMQIDRHPGSAKVDDWRRSLVEAEGSLSTVNEKLAEQEAKMRELNARIDENTKARTENKTALDETDATGTKYLAQLQRQADFAGKLTEVQRVNIAIEKGYAGVLSKGDKELALRNAALVDQANATKTVTKATNDSANAYQALYDRLYPAEAAQRQYNKELGLLSDRLAGDKLADAVNRLNFAIDGADATGPGDAIEEYRKELERLEDQLDPVGKATEQYQKDVERLNDAM
ncbi:MAG: tape measure protein, partial [Alphaproteobacteria bacterium]|nr:tape measure protein [Alphaproteobacteria bacterium]